MSPHVCDCGRIVPVKSRIRIKLCYSRYLYRLNDDDDIIIIIIIIIIITVKHGYSEAQWTIKISSLYEYFIIKDRNY